VIFKDPRHPYTQGLLASLPNRSKRGRTLHSIPGTVPDPAFRPPGCPFHPRCGYAIETCRVEFPELYDYGDATCPAVRCCTPEKCLMTVMLKVEGLKKYFPCAEVPAKDHRLCQAVDGVDFAIDQGKTLDSSEKADAGNRRSAGLSSDFWSLIKGLSFTRATTSPLFLRRRYPPEKGDADHLPGSFRVPEPQDDGGQSIEEGLRTIRIRNRTERRARVEKLLNTVGMVLLLQTVIPMSSAAGRGRGSASRGRSA